MVSQSLPILKTAIREFPILKMAIRVLLLLKKTTFFFPLLKFPLKKILLRRLVSLLLTFVRLCTIRFSVQYSVELVFVQPMVLIRVPGTYTSTPTTI